MKKELNKYLKSLTEKELIQEVKKLYDKFESVKKYYELELGESTEKILEEFKERIKKEYFPKRGFGKARNSESKKVISEFRKISVHQKDIVELLLYRTEMILAFTNEYGDMNASYYSSLESGFEQACKLIKKEQLRSEYRNYCQELVGKSFGFGWGIHDTLRHYYREYVD